VSAGRWVTPNTDDVIGCDELPCVDVGVGIYHHPYCGMSREEAEYDGPDTPEDEEGILASVPDPVRAS
jgi:hypothetical protein